MTDLPRFVVVEEVRPLPYTPMLKSMIVAAALVATTASAEEYDTSVLSCIMMRPDNEHVQRRVLFPNGELGIAMLNRGGGWNVLDVMPCRKFENIMTCQGTGERGDVLMYVLDRDLGFAELSNGKFVHGEFRARDSLQLDLECSVLEEPAE